MRLDARDMPAGKKVRCPGCKNVFAIAAPAPAPRSRADEAYAKPPYFIAHAYYTWRPNRYYRVYVRSDDFVFIWAGGAGELTAGMAAQGGAIGGFFAARKAKKLSDRAEVIDDTPLDELIEGDKRNFVADPSGFTEATFLPRTFWMTVATGGAVPYVGRLLMRHSEHGKLNLLFEDVKQMDAALRMVPPLLGDLVEVEVRWSEKKQKFLPR
jgi:hypothetical protein